MSKPILEINGVEIKANSLYKIIDKYDASAPDGMRKEGMTKVPHPDVADSFQCRYVVTNPDKKTGVWDTGFYVESPCYANLDEKVKKAKVAALKKHLVTPYENLHGKGILDQSNDEFWSSQNFKVSTGDVLNTENVNDLMTVYIAVKDFHVAPDDKLKSKAPRYKDCAYCIQDKELAQSARQKRSLGKMACLAHFNTLLTTNKPTLINLLQYIGMVGVSDKSDNDTLNASFFDWINYSDNNVTRYEAAQVLHKDEINLHKVVKEKIQQQVIVKSGNGYWFEGVELGIDAKKVAKNLHTSKDLEPIKMKLLGLEK